MSKTPKLIIGHRGAHGLAPDNTIEGFQLALDYQLDMIETDLQASADGVVLLLHDKELATSDGQLQSVSELSYTQLKELIPQLVTLTELLDYSNRRIRLMLEFKTANAIEPALAILRGYLKKGWVYSDFMFASFDFEILKQVRQDMPEVEMAVLEQWSGVRATHRARALRTNYLSMDQRFLWWGFVWMISRQYHLFCYPHVKLYHIKHYKPAKWFKWGLYGNITDRPDLYKTKRSDDESKAAPHRELDREHQDVLV